MNVYRVKTGSILPLGKQGENLARKIQFDISRWISTFGPGTVQLLHQRSGDEAPYPVAVEREGNFAVWKVTNADTAAPGTGHAELQYYVGDALAKSETWMTKVFPALGPAGETPPEAQQGWVDQVLQAGAEAAEAADRAEEAAVRQPYPNAETGTWWVWNAESGAYEDTGISYGTGDSGGGVTDHEKLTGRDKADQHPMIAITGLEDALAGKQPTGTYLTEETDPTVPDWAKQTEKPSYTADEVGALSAETLPKAINTALVQAKESGAFDGKSAYQYAVEGGYTGTEESFAAKLAAEYLLLSGGTMTGKIVFPVGNQDVGISNDGDVKILGYGSGYFRFGDPSYPMQMRGSGANPLYGEKSVLLDGDVYSKEEVDAALGAYITDVAALVGGDA